MVSSSEQYIVNVCVVNIVKYIYHHVELSPLNLLLKFKDLVVGTET